jgi:YVTN family beta-propeller protein
MQGIVTIGVGSGPVDVAVTGKMAYVVNQGSGTVSVVMLDRKAVLKTITVGSQPSHAVLSQNGQYLYVSDTGSDSVSIISTQANEVVATVKE